MFKEVLMNYIYAPSGSQKTRNDLLNFLFEEIGRIYGRKSNENLRKKGIQYIVSKVPGGKVCHVKNMIKVIRNKYSIINEKHSKYCYKMHKFKYGKYAQALIDCIKKDKYLLYLVRDNCENGEILCSEIIYGDEIIALELLINNCSKIKNNKSKNTMKYAINIKKEIKKNDFIL
jgi:hypothetical protein